MEKEAECVECNTHSVYINSECICSKYIWALTSLTLRRMAQLSANHLGSFRIESSVTDSTPGIIDADLHPPSIPANRPLPPASLNSPCKQLAARESENLLQESYSRFTVRGL